MQQRTSTTTSPAGPIPRHQPQQASAEYRRLWAMTPAQRVAAMWRSELTVRQLCQWSSRAPREIPLLGGEFAWIAMHTPEWAEAADDARRAA
jgi:hypothetical protein